MAKDFRESFNRSLSGVVKSLAEEKLEETIEKKEETNNENNSKFRLKRKQKNKENKVQFLMYVNEDFLEKIERLAKKLNYRRNDLIIKMIDYCIENFEFEED